MLSWIAPWRFVAFFALLAPGIAFRVVLRSAGPQILRLARPQALRLARPHMLLGNRADRLKKRTARFDGMLERLSLDQAALACVDDHRLRKALRGVAEAGRTPPVRSAFQILYEDLAPIRLAADLIFSPRLPLQATVDEAASSSKTLADVASAKELNAARKIFDAIDADGSGEISREELLGSGVLSIINPEEPEDVGLDHFMRSVDIDQSGGVSFVEFATYAASCEQLDGADLADVLASVSDGLGIGANAESASKESACATYDGMLEKFAEWEIALGFDKKKVEEDDRLGRVLLGCFAGSHVPEIVEALKVCYVDFLPLRVAGDLIFKVMCEVFERRISKELDMAGIGHGS